MQLERSGYVEPTQAALVFGLLFFFPPASDSEHAVLKFSRNSSLVCADVKQRGLDDELLLI